jgi:dethiobiotin synthetase
MRTIVVTGTGTEVGKTVVTAAVAAVAAAAGNRVAVVKPAQTGVPPGGESDAQAVTRLTGLTPGTDVHELARYPDPLAPATAARRAGIRPLPATAIADRIRRLAGRDLVLVEGAGGLLVRLDEQGATIADVAAVLGAGLLVVTTAALGTLNATALTCEAIAARGLSAIGIVIGAWPARPGLAARANLSDLPAYAGSPLLGALPESIGRSTRAEFLRLARNSLAPELGGIWPAHHPPAAACPPRQAEKERPLQLVTSPLRWGPGAAHRRRPAEDPAAARCRPASGSCARRRWWRTPRR